MNILFGKSGKPVGSFDGDWLFDADGVAVGFVAERVVYPVKGGKPVGYIVSSVLYDRGRAVVAVGKVPKLRILPTLARLSPLAPRLTAIGVSVVDEPVITLEPPFDGFSLTETLKGYGED